MLPSSSLMAASVPAIFKMKNLSIMPNVCVKSLGVYIEHLPKIGAARQEISVLICGAVASQKSWYRRVVAARNL